MARLGRLDEKLMSRGWLLLDKKSPRRVNPCKKPKENTNLFKNTEWWWGALVKLLWVVTAGNRRYPLCVMVPSWNNSNVPSPSLVVVLAAGMELTLLVSLSLFLFHWTSSKLTDNYSSHLKETRGKLGLKVTSLSFIPNIKSPKAKLPLMNFFILPVRHKRSPDYLQKFQQCWSL